MRLYTAEQVAPGHPDKFCDQVSDRLLTRYLAQDPSSKCAIECAAKGNTVFVFGEVTSDADVSIESEVAGLWGALYGSEPEVVVRLDQQSPEIFHKVQFGGAGDQGIMTGYATNETAMFLPKSYVYATEILRWVQGTLGGTVTASDAKSQVTLTEDGGINHILLSVQQLPHTDLDLVRERIEDQVYSILRGILFEDQTPLKISINPGGLWYDGGPSADSGLTGRKITADTYGPSIPHGGGAFSGKDPSKVDRSGAYMARYVAKNLVNQGLASKAQVQVAYEIGSEEPVSLDVNTFGTGSEQDALRFVNEFDWTPEGISDQLSLLTVEYDTLCVWGHFTHSDAPWEQLID